MNYQREPRNPRDFRSGASDYCWGSGLTPKSLEDAPPSEGGRYRGTSSDTTKVIGVGQH